MEDNQGVTARPTDPDLVSDQAAARLDPPGFDPSRVAEAVSLVEVSHLQPIIRKAADEFYDQLYTAVEDYLKENLDYNLTQHITMLERENRRMSRELYELGAIVGPPWFNHEARLEQLREMAAAKAELSNIKYRLAFGNAIATEARRAETGTGSVHEGAGRKASPKHPQIHRSKHHDR